MKNILLPSLLEQDTTDAFAAGLKYAAGSPCRIILLIPQDMPEAFTASSILRNMRKELTPGQKEVLSRCRHLAGDNNGTVHIHYQPGITGPLLKGILEHYNVQLILFANSYRQMNEKLHVKCRQLLQNCKTPILQLGQYCREQDYNKALYIEGNKSSVPVEKLQAMVRDIFSFKIISHVWPEEERIKDEITPKMAETIIKNNIDIIVETRKAERIKLKPGKRHENEIPGLSVLSLYEEAL